MKKLEITNLPKLPFGMTEALNQLRVNLGFCGENIRTIMITSTVPNEGKSFIAMGLWRMMANLGLRTLFIDCDLRNSELRSKYGIKGSGLAGLAYYLSGKAELQDVIYETNIPNGYMIPVTQNIANPAILLEGKRFKPMIENCSEAFDYVLIDTPPLASVADALNIAPHCDGSLLVVGSGVAPRKLVQDSVQMLRRTDSALLGMVLNRVQMDRKRGSYYSRYYRYGRYGKSYGYGSGERKSTQ